MSYENIDPHSDLIIGLPAPSVYEFSFENDTKYQFKYKWSLPVKEAIALEKETATTITNLINDLDNAPEKFNFDTIVSIIYHLMVTNEPEITNTYIHHIIDGYFALNYNITDLIEEIQNAFENLGYTE